MVSEGSWASGTRIGSPAPLVPAVTEARGAGMCTVLSPAPAAAAAAAPSFDHQRVPLLFGPAPLAASMMSSARPPGLRVGSVPLTPFTRTSDVLGVAGSAPADTGGQAGGGVSGGGIDLAGWVAGAGEPAETAGRSVGRAGSGAAAGAPGGPEPAAGGPVIASAVKAWRWLVRRPVTPP